MCQGNTILLTGPEITQATRIQVLLNRTSWIHPHSILKLAEAGTSQAQ